MHLLSLRLSYKGAFFGNEYYPNLVFTYPVSLAYMHKKEQWANLLRNYPSFVKSNFRSSIYKALRGEAEDLPELNDYGEFIGHLNLEFTDESLHPSLIKQLSSKELISTKNLSSAVSLFTKFKADVKSANANLVIAYPPIPAAVYENHRAQIVQIIKGIRDISDMMILNEEDFMTYPNHLFFSSFNHLNAKGRERRTKELSNSLNDYLQAGRQI